MGLADTEDIQLYTPPGGIAGGGGGYHPPPITGYSFTDNFHRADSPDIANPPAFPWLTGGAGGHFQITGNQAVVPDADDNPSNWILTPNVLANCFASLTYTYSEGPGGQASGIFIGDPNGEDALWFLEQTSGTVYAVYSIFGGAATMVASGTEGIGAGSHVLTMNVIDATHLGYSIDTNPELFVTMPHALTDNNVGFNATVTAGASLITGTLFQITES